MYFTLEIQHAVKSGREMDFLARLKELKGKNGHIQENIMDNMILHYIQNPKPDDSVTCTPSAGSHSWHSYLEAPSRIKIRMSC